jgi:predicted Zn-dependent protease
MRKNHFSTLAFSVVAMLLALFSQAAGATPYTPSSGDQVLVTLPRHDSPAHAELHRLRLLLKATPDDLALATRLARLDVAMARSESDSRYLGYAQAALAPWWPMPAPPAPVRLLRATILQSNHHFSEALADLDGVLGAEPDNRQAWLARATILTIQGDYRQATLACARVSALSTELVTVTCLANIATLTGNAAKSEQLLERTLGRSAGADADLQIWTLTVLAEMATRRGDAATAETRYRRALALNPRDGYLLGAYADFLLDQHRPDDVLELVKDQTRSDALLLRHALALQQMPDQGKNQAADEAELCARFNAARERRDGGDAMHRREQARFELFLRQNAVGALELARQNWAVQKEAADMRIVLEAAVQARDADGADAVVAWIAANKVEDVAATRLIRQLQQIKAGS